MLVLGALISIPRNLGYVALAGLVGAESSGLPVPGETALITAGILAQQGKLTLVWVIVIAAGAAIVGDNIGYLLGRRLGHAALVRGRWQKERRTRMLAVSERFFERHGAKAVFFGRWLPVLRVWAAWVAGATEMHWRTFVVFNAAGGILWATTVGLAAYLVGHAATTVFATGGIVAGVAVVVVLVVVYGVFNRRTHRRVESAGEEPPAGG
ncbi:MAG TPA: DedA family protein [Solirubrobacteraceae bacterium]|nr:DedA family protein [Solirubrobacteraceae bacterium]